MSKDEEYFEAMYNVRASVADAHDYFDLWKQRSEEFLKSRGHRANIEVSYGADKMETMDVFRPKGRSAGLLMFIHGGYWRSLDKKDHSFVAEPYVKAGFTVAVINYSLCPQVDISQICRQVASAGGFLYRNAAAMGFPPERMYVAGHSAGGHLATMALACLWRQIDYRFPEKVFSAGLSVSGIYDLRVLTRVHSVNADLQLTFDSAKKVSPALMPPPKDVLLTIAIGEDEIGGFLDQHHQIARRWPEVVGENILCANNHHFDILLGFADENHVLGKAMMRILHSKIDA